MLLLFLTYRPGNRVLERLIKFPRITKLLSDKEQFYVNPKFTFLTVQATEYKRQLS